MYKNCIYSLSRISELLDYTAEDFTDLSMYKIIHAEDVEKFEQKHADCKHHQTIFH